MKKLLFVFIALAVAQVSAQDLKIKSAEKAATAAPASKMGTDSMIEQLAASQTKSLAKRLALSEAQSEQVSDLVVMHLKSPKMQEMLAMYSPEKYLGDSGTKAVQSFLFKEKSFTNGLGKILNEDQMTKFKAVNKM